MCKSRYSLQLVPLYSRNMQDKLGNIVYGFRFLPQLVAWAITHFAYRKGYLRTLIVLSMVISLMSAGFFNTTISMDAFAKKKSSDRLNGSVSKHSRDKVSDTGTDNSLQREEEKQGSESLPLPVETPTNSKFVIINFDDSHESDYTYAKPILDRYGFKATFFEVCGWIEAGYHDKDTSITWEQITALQQDGMDIELLNTMI